MLLIWWYTAGLLALLRHVRERLRSFAHSMNLDVMTRYLFVPMYGYYDFWSRVISFFVRLVQLAFGMVAGVIYLIVEVVVVICWILVPIVVVGNILYQIFGYLW